MALKKKPVTGMRDVLPAEMQIRDYVMNQIKETYKQFGFSQIETPCVEHIENLTSKQGGDNEKLIFKILKRGDKLDVGSAQTEADVVDGGLRYDLVPFPFPGTTQPTGQTCPRPLRPCRWGAFGGRIARRKGVSASLSSVISISWVRPAVWQRLS